MKYGITVDTLFALKSESEAQVRTDVDQGHTNLIPSKSKMCAPSGLAVGNWFVATLCNASLCSRFLELSKFKESIASQRKRSAASNAESGS